jgi:hypothetical protein
MANFFRLAGAIIAGAVLAMVLIVAIEFFGSIVHPTPPDFQGTMEEMYRHVERIPPWFLAVAVALWGATAFASTWTARRLGNRGCGLVIGLLLLTALIFNLVQLPYPIWFKVANLLVIPIAIATGCRLWGRHVTAAETITDGASVKSQ